MPRVRKLEEREECWSDPRAGGGLAVECAVFVEIKTTAVQLWRGEES